MALVLRYGTAWDGTNAQNVRAILPFVAASWFLWNLLYAGMKLDGFRRGWRFPAVVSELFMAVCCLMAALLAVGFLLRDYASRLTLAYFGLVLFVGFVAIRYFAHSLLRIRYRKGEVRRAVIAGSGRVAREIAIKIERHPELLCRVVGFLYPQDASAEVGSLPAAANATDELSTLSVISLLREREVNELVLALSRVPTPEVLNLVARCRDQGVNVSLVPQPYELYLSRPNLLDLGGLPLLQLQDVSRTAMLRWKRVVDLVLGGVLAVPASFVVWPSALFLRVKKGRAFCWDKRCGRFGQPFCMLRLNVDRHQKDGSWLESLLVHLSITEIPQLWNVLKGEMSLVGPRPESPERVRRYSEWQQQRLSVRPGMTGLAQVHGLREQHSSEEKTRLDLQYFLHPSPWTDLSLLLQTLGTLVMRLVFVRGRKQAEPTIPGSILYNVFDTHFMQENVHGAHRPQPSAD